jgi:hypothetical protein
MNGHGSEPSTSSQSTDDVEVAVIGAGQTGLTIGYFLRRQGRRFVIVDDGRLRHRRGVTDVPGLYFLGLTWQQTRGSALIGWVKDDAAFIAEPIAADQESKAPPAREKVGVGTPAQARSTERN